MLSEERVHEIQKKALERAERLSDDSLRREAANLHVEHHDAPPGDERTELGIMDSIFTEEMIRRGLTAR